MVANPASSGLAREEASGSSGGAAYRPNKLVAALGMQTAGPVGAGASETPTQAQPTMADIDAFLAAENGTAGARQESALDGVGPASDSPSQFAEIDAYLRKLNAAAGPTPQERRQAASEGLANYTATIPGTGIPKAKAAEVATGAGQGAAISAARSGAKFAGGLAGTAVGAAVGAAGGPGTAAVTAIAGGIAGASLAAGAASGAESAGRDISENRRKAPEDQLGSAEIARKALMKGVGTGAATAVGGTAGAAATVAGGPVAGYAAERGAEMLAKKAGQKLTSAMLGGKTKQTEKDTPTAPPARAGGAMAAPYEAIKRREAAKNFKPVLTPAQQALVKVKKMGGNAVEDQFEQALGKSTKPAGDALAGDGRGADDNFFDAMNDEYHKELDDMGPDGVEGIGKAAVGAYSGGKAGAARYNAKQERLQREKDAAYGLDKVGRGDLLRTEEL
ncbi:MAG TPA: hypothetical protein DFR83_00595 [Deltaproteobacteria bacterium]|nr:hypothetical protein [Deltaproteobacteria bacterium]